MGKLFGTDGIRGIVNKELTPELAMRAGMAVAEVLNALCKDKPKVFVGKDTRLSSDMIESALISGMCSMGCNVICLGVIPTPGVAFLVRKHLANAGIMISASHNSFEFNGIKIFDKNGYKLSDELEGKIESIILSKSALDLPFGENIGKITRVSNYKLEYIKHLIENVNIPQNKLKIIFDCSNGSASFTARDIFTSFCKAADFIYENPNGTNINKNCGSTNIENLSKKVIQGGYDLGISFDGDADRCLAVDNKGEIIDGDAIIGICANYMKSKGNLRNNTIVGTVMSNLGLKKFCEENNILFKETNVGDRFVLEEMIESKCVLGGEQSGHIIFKDYSTTGDGQLTALKLIEVILNSNKSLSCLNSMIKKYPQKSLSIDIPLNQKGFFSNNNSINKYLEEIQKEISDDGKIIIRESGTEPKIRIMVEHKSIEKLQQIISSAEQLIKKLIRKD